MHVCNLLTSDAIQQSVLPCLPKSLDYLLSDRTLVILIFHAVASSATLDGIYERGSVPNGNFNCRKPISLSN